MSLCGGTKTAEPAGTARCAAAYDTPLGQLLLMAEDDALVGVWFAGQRHAPDAAALLPCSRAPSAVLLQAMRWLDRYFAGAQPTPDALPLAPAGTPFQKQVWQLLRAIPYGQTTTYQVLADQMAAQLGVERMSAQAIGGAVGRNPIAIILPCHRVIASGGTLGGYAGGAAKKQWLLQHENAHFRADTASRGGVRNAAP